MDTLLFAALVVGALIGYSAVIVVALHLWIRHAQRRSKVAAYRAMIQRAIERMYDESEDNQFLEVTYANGDKAAFDTLRKAGKSVDTLPAPVVAELQKLFLAAWQNQKGPALPTRADSTRVPFDFIASTNVRYPANNRSVGAGVA